MCGLFGYIGTPEVVAAQRAAVAEAVEQLHHRGPDETGIAEVYPGVVFGFKRLAVLDVESSNQPLRYADGRYTIVFNGEIYNYRELRQELIESHGAAFTTAGDAEVIVAAYHVWGPHAVSRLRGMFAFVIWDVERGRVFAARDRFGIKPLYYLETPHGLYLASEKKSLMAFLPVGGAAQVDPASLSSYLTMQYVPEPATMHTAVRRLPAGHWCTYTIGAVGGLSAVRYHRPDFRPAPVAAPELLYRDIAAALRDSVAAHMVADVPVGAFLSSGIDSASIVAMAREVNPNIPTFTAAMDVEGYDEHLIAERTAAALGVPNSAVVVTPQMMMDALPRLVWHLDDPIADPSLVPLYFVARQARREVTVALSGEGADELFGGYGIYREPHSLRLVSELPEGLRHGLRAVARAIPEGVKGRSFLERGTTPIEDRYYGNARIFSAEKKALLLRGAQAGDAVCWTTESIYAECAHLGDVEKMQYVDMCTWLRGDILVKADRMSMANALEVRVPYLDQRVFAVASTIPTALKVPAGSSATKLALRRALEGIVPEHVVNRPKLGFPTPIRVWLRKEMYPWAEHIIATSGAGGLIDLEYALGLLREHAAGIADRSRQIWTILVFCLWYAMFVDGTLVIDPAGSGYDRLGSPIHQGAPLS